MKIQKFQVLLDDTTKVDCVDLKIALILSITPFIPWLRNMLMNESVQMSNYVDTIYFAF